MVVLLKNIPLRLQILSKKKGIISVPEMPYNFHSFHSPLVTMSIQHVLRLLLILWSTAWHSAVSLYCSDMSKGTINIVQHGASFFKPRVCFYKTHYTVS